MVFAILFIHELSHVIMAKILNESIAEIEILPVGFTAKLNNYGRYSYKKEFFIAIAGPLSNLLLLFLAKSFGVLAGFFILANMFICFINLIPSFPLDGGRVLRSILSRFFGAKKSTYYVSNIGIINSVILFVASIFLAFRNYFYLNIAILSIFLYFYNVSEKRFSYYKFYEEMFFKKEEYLKKGIIEIKYILVSKDFPVKKLIDIITPNRFFYFEVVDPKYNVIGIVSERKLFDYILNYGMNSTIGEVLRTEVKKSTFNRGG